MFFVLLTTLVILIVIFYIIYKKRYEEFWKHIMAIPGPKAYPVVGTNYHIESPEKLWIREREYAKQYYPIYKQWVFNLAFVNLVSPEDVELVLNNSKHNNKSMIYDFMQCWLGTGLLTSEGSKMRKRRKILTPAFHFSILQEFTEIFNSETQLLVENLKKLCDEPFVDVIKPITEFTLCAIGETSLGVTLRDDPKCVDYKQAVHEFGETFSKMAESPWLLIPFIYKLSDTYQHNTKIVRILHDFSTNVIKEKNKVFNKEACHSDKKKLALLDLMLKAKLDGADIDDEGIREELDTFIFGGHDTTSISLTFTLMVLANHQEIQEELYQEIISIIDETQNPSFADLGELKFMERCIKESLRLYPPAAIIGRVAGEDLKTKSGYTIPKGCNININICDMHRSSELWEDPEKFDPDRFLPDNISKRHPFSYLPFSAGSRNCIGQKYAMLEMKVALCGILKNFKLEPYDRPEHIKFKPDIILRSSEPVRVTLVPRK